MGESRDGMNVADRDDQVPMPHFGRDGRGAGRLVAVEGLLAVAAYAVMCVLVLLVGPQPAEPDDGAYRASIVAMTHGHFLTLTRSQVLALSARLDDNPTAPPNQWVEVTRGRYVSEKDPGYPFLAAPFAALGVIRWAPLFYGALGCLGLFLGARRWLGPGGGLAAVGLYCSSGATLAFAWRDYMPTFAEASLVAAGTGALVWALLATKASRRRRTWTGLAGFLALEAATFVRYTDVVVLGCAVVVVMMAIRHQSSQLARSSVAVWVGSVAIFAVGVAGFDTVVYGGPLTSGYPPGEVSFSVGVVGSNLRSLLWPWVRAMPVSLFALTAGGWLLGRWLVLRHDPAPASAVARRDLAVAAGLVGSWWAIWGLYLTYTWTTDPTNVAVQLVRFYLPGLGAMALLGAWLVTRFRGRPLLALAASTVVLVVLFALGTWAFHSMYAEFGVPLDG